MPSTLAARMEGLKTPRGRHLRGRGPNLVGGTDMAQRTCSVGGCEDKHYGKGYCRKHWYEARRNGTLPAPLCSVEGCESVVVGQGLCHKHWQRIKLRGIENVGEPAQRDLSISERFWEKGRKDRDVLELDGRSHSRVWPFLSKGQARTSSPRRLRTACRTHSRGIDH